MLPLRIKLYKNKGILKGLGLDTIEIDYTKFSPGLIAICGPSGSGKSSLQNSLHPYRKSGKTDFKNMFLPDGYKEFEFEFKGRHYLSQVYVDKAQLFVYNEDGTLELLNNNKTDKVSDYDKAVTQYFGKWENFVKLLYGGRKFANIMQLEPSDRKMLFVDYLLDHLQKYKDYEEVLKAEHDTKLKELNVYQINFANLAEYEDKKNQLNLEIGNAEITVQEYNERLLPLKEQQKLFEQQEKENEKIKEELNKISQDKYKSEIDYNNSIKELNDIVVKYEKIKKEWLELKDVVEIEQPKQSLENITNSIQELENDLKGIVKLKNENKNKNAKIQTEIDIKKKLLEKLQATSLPCTSELQLKCPFTNLKSYPDAIDVLNKEIDALNSELIEDDGSLETDEIGIGTKIWWWKEQKTQWDNYQLNKNKIEKKVELGNEGKKYRDEVIPLLEQNKNKLEKIVQDLQTQFNVLNETIKTKQFDQSAVINNMSNQLTVVLTEIKLKKEQLIEVDKKLETSQYIKKTIERLQKELDEYPLMIEFFSKTGGMLYEIERAGEEVSKVTNKFLENYHNKSIKVKFDTLRPSADNKKLLEVFDINFSINGADWCPDLSDGEEVIAARAIAEGFSYLKPEQKEFKSVMLDELDGSLDPKARLDYIKLLEQCSEMNGRKYTFLITHSVEVMSHFQQQIEFGENTITLKH